MVVLVSFQPLRGQDWIQEAGDILQIALPAGAGVSTVVHQDWEGSRQFGLSFGTSWLTTYALKSIYGKLRPDGSARNSWPSGHTMGAFAGASFLYTRYGRAFGIPAYVLAGFTGYSRVHADKHYADDVLAGASIAMLSNWYFVTPFSNRLDVAFLPGGDGYRLEMAYRLDSAADPWGKLLPKGDDGYDGYDGKVRYRFAFGPAYVREDRLVAVGAGEGQLNVTDFEQTDDPTTTSSVLVAWDLDGRNTVGASIWPFESRDNGRLAHDAVFAGMLFPSGTKVRAAYRLYDLRFSYRFLPMEEDRWRFRIGADASFRWTELDVMDTTGILREGDSDFVLLPLLGLNLSYRGNLLLQPEINLAGVYLGENRLLDADCSLRVRLDAHWDCSAGYEYYGQEISDEGILNRVSYDILYLAVAHTF